MAALVLAELFGTVDFQGDSRVAVRGMHER